MLKKTELKILLSPLFIFCLLTLLVNDFFLKDLFHNVITGKLSDFSGLIVFSLFFYSLFPKNKKVIFILTALLFVLWKSPFSENFILFWNLHMPFAITRVIDFTDLSALLMLPIAYYYSKNKYFVFRMHPSFIIVLCLISFVSTSRPKDKISFTEPLTMVYSYNGSHNFTKRKSLLEKELPLLKRVSYRYEIKNNKIYLSINGSDLNYNPHYKDYYEESKVKDKISRDFQRFTVRNKFLTNLKVHNYKGNLFNTYSSLQFKNSLLHGEQIYFNKNKTISQKDYYSKGLPTGVWLYFSQDGKIIKKTTFSSGEKIKSEIISSNKSRIFQYKTRKSRIQLILLFTIGSVFFIIFFVFKLFKTLKLNHDSIYTSIDDQWKKIALTLLVTTSSFLFSLLSVFLGLYTISFSIFGKFNFFMQSFFAFIFIGIYFFIYLIFSLKKRSLKEFASLFCLNFFIYTTFLLSLQIFRIEW